jgi:hypothetical protein
MRMWLVNPKIMCRNHLLGEHNEIHAFCGSINKGISMAGYIRNNLLEYKSLHNRHDELVEEMLRRNYNHKSPLYEITTNDEVIASSQVDTDLSFHELISRCSKCKENYENMS